MNLRKVGVKVQVSPGGLAGAVGCLLVLVGCGLSNLDGPGPCPDPWPCDGENLIVVAKPDFVRADGHSTVWIAVQLLGCDGVALEGRRVALALTDPSGMFADIGVLAHESVMTGSDGSARVKYIAPLRQHFSANSSVLVTGQVEEGNGSSFIARTVEIEIRSMETRP